MISGINAGFGELIGADLLADLRARGLTLIRQDCQIGHRPLSPAITAVLAQEIVDAGLRPLLIVWDETQLTELPAGVDVELRNEPDLEGPAASAYAALLERVADIAEDRSLRLWVGAVSNLHDRGFRYLRAILQAAPADVGISVHWYPHARGYTHTGMHPGFVSREAETAHLRDVIGDRRFGVSEIGYHTARHCRGWWFWRRCAWLDDVDVYHFARWERTFWEREGAAFLAWFQLNDGPQESAEHRYGIRRSTGEWKPVAHVFAERQLDGAEAVMRGVR